MDFFSGNSSENSTGNISKNSLDNSNRIFSGNFSENSFSNTSGNSSGYSSGKSHYYNSSCSAADETKQWAIRQITDRYFFHRHPIVLRSLNYCTIYWWVLYKGYWSIRMKKIVIPMQTLNHLRFIIVSPIALQFCTINAMGSKWNPKSGLKRGFIILSLIEKLLRLYSVIIICIICYTLAYEYVPDLNLHL